MKLKYCVLQGKPKDHQDAIDKIRTIESLIEKLGARRRELSNFIISDIIGKHGKEDYEEKESQ